MDGRIEGWRTPSSSWAGHSRAGGRAGFGLARSPWWPGGDEGNAETEAGGPACLRCGGRHVGAWRWWWCCRVGARAWARRATGAEAGGGGCGWLVDRPDPLPLVAGRRAGVTIGRGGAAASGAFAPPVAGVSACTAKVSCGNLKPWTAQLLFATCSGFFQNGGLLGTSGSARPPRPSLRSGKGGNGQPPAPARQRFHSQTAMAARSVGHTRRRCVRDGDRHRGSCAQG
jgi:hypothetical protein